MIKRNRNSIQDGFKEYLTELDVSKEYLVDGSEKIRFHWANWDLTCRLIKDGPLCLYTKESMIDQINEKIEGLRDEKVWINNKLQTLESSVYDLYEFYMDPRVRKVWFSKNQSTLVSDESIKGPFSRVTSLKWKERETFAHFVYKRILQDTFQLRNFRLSTDVPFKVQFDEFRQNDLIGSICQFSPVGVLCLIETKKSQIISEKPFAKLVINKESLNDLFEYIGSDFGPLEEADLQHFDFKVPTNYLMKSPSESDVEQSKQFVFLPFTVMQSNEKGKIVSNCLKDISFDLYTMFDEVFQNDLSAFHAWVKKIA